ncbi:hypothetical protein PsalN5692_00871 [Piscirickettsia salmonis]|nr:hypothetical protein PsalN5692_00871 [Piscirickettsia salmonis]
MLAISVDDINEIENLTKYFCSALVKNSNPISSNQPKLRVSYCRCEPWSARHGVSRPR